MDSDFLDALPALYARFQAERAALTGQIPGASHPIAADLDLNLSDMMSLPLPSSGPPATDQPTGEPASDPTQYSAEEYLSKSRKFTTAKKHFRHALKTAAVKADVWGTKTYSKLTRGELHYIHKEVFRVCPSLTGKSMEMDEVLKASLSLAKYYRLRKLKGSTSISPLSSGHGDEAPASSSNAATTSTSQESAQEKEPGQEKPALEKPAHEESVQEKHSMKKSSSKKKKKKKGKHRHHKRVHSLMEDVEVSSSDDDQQGFEMSIAARRAANKELLAGLKQAKTPTGPFKSGDSIIIMHQGVQLATGLFASQVNDMYSKVIFQNHIQEDTDVELPASVQACDVSGRKEKCLVSELEEDDIFLWKVEKILKKGTGATAEPSPPEPAVKTEKAAPISSFYTRRDPSKRVTKPTSKYSMYTKS